ncbi:DUF222 domain-containing protein [Mycobacterium shimoidei]|nr:DUF222 domain-containing protein [Mycobacterium shimoidei]
MSSIASPAAGVRPAERLEVLSEELAELAGQRNAIDGRIVQIAAELYRDGLWGITGARSLAAVVTWKLGWSSANAHTMVTVKRRVEQSAPQFRGVPIEQHMPGVVITVGAQRLPEPDNRRGELCCTIRVFRVGSGLCYRWRGWAVGAPGRSGPAAIRKLPGGQRFTATAITDWLTLYSTGDPDIRVQLVAENIARRTGRRL